MVTEGGGFYTREYEDLRNEYMTLWRHIHWDDYPDDPVTTKLFNDSRHAWQNYWLNYRREKLR